MSMATVKYLTERSGFRFRVLALRPALLILRAGAVNPVLGRTYGVEEYTTMRYNATQRPESGYAVMK